MTEKLIDAKLSPGWVVGEDGAVRRETVHSMLRRLPGWDYRGRAIYQITVTLADRAGGPLGRLEVRRKPSAENGREGNSAENDREGNLAENGREQNGGWLSVGQARELGLRPEEIEARVVASAFGEAALEALAEMSQLYPQVEILAVQLMPDHVHYVAFVKAPLDRPFGALVRGFKAGAVKRWKAQEEALGRERPRTEPGRERPRTEPGGSVPPRSRGGVPSWSPGFQDTVLLHAGQLANMKRYLADNPRRLAVKRLFPGLFRVVSRLGVTLRLGGENSAVHGWFMALGNRFLLERPIVQVQVSRRDFGYRRETKPGGSTLRGSGATGSRGSGATGSRGAGATGGLKIARDAAGEPLVEFASPLFAEKKAALLAAAKHGAVLLSPCVSDGERQIAREALAAGHRLVVLKNKGFAPLEKPSGRLFDACSDGRLLMLAPAAWPYLPGEKPMTRFDATAMNRLCQALAGDGAAEINYHGMKPNNIDALALAAVEAHTRCGFPTRTPQPAASVPVDAESFPRHINEEVNK